MAEHK